ncbi:MAG: cyclase family protein, partial [Myxococcales bacterium]|nr:cyclase family protein [Myxococcales bacterium]
MTLKSRKLPGLFALALPLFVAGCDEAGCDDDSPKDEPAVDAPFEQWDLVDLSHTYEANIPIYPGGVPFELQNLATIDQGYYINMFTTGEHVGTHVDAPSHFSEGGAHVDQLPLTALTGPLVLLDISPQAEEENDYAVTVDDLQAWEQEHGEIPSGAFVVANSGWWQRWSEPESYLNTDAEGIMRFPGFSAEAVDFLLESREVLGIGVDTLSTDIGSSATFDEHHLFLGAGKIHIENLTNLDGLPAS